MSGGIRKTTEEQTTPPLFRVSLFEKNSMGYFKAITNANI